jgi:hypothetical protein
MDNQFKKITDGLGIPAAEVAEALGIPVQSYRQARLARTNRNYRPPPKGWEHVLFALVGKRILEFGAITESLEEAIKPEAESELPQDTSSGSTPR